MPLEQYGFGVGSLFGVRTDISNPTPVRFGTVQDVTVDMSFTVKELMGQYQAPVAVARGGMKITGKVKAAKLNARAFNDIFWGQTLAVGEIKTVLDEGGAGGTAIPTTPFQLTAVNGATFLDDLGVINAGTGAQMQRVASAPAAGQYAVNMTTGVYTFASADNVSAIKVQLSYTYTETATGGRITATNQLMGSSPIFRMVLNEGFQSNALTLVLHQCIATKLTLNFKNEDFVIPEFDFAAFANSTGQFADFNADVT